MKNSHRAVIVAIFLTTAAGCAETAAEAERDPQSIRAAVREHSPEVAACYEAILEQHPEAQGTVVARFVIEPSGAVSEAVIERDELASPELEACLLASVASWSFPRAEGDEATTVRYPFAFRPQVEEAPRQAERLDATAIRGAFAEARADIRRCYEAGLEEDPGLEGRVDVRLVIAEDGRVSRLSLEGSTLDSEGVSACLMERLSALSFPAHGGGEVTVTYPLVFAAD